jgi:hypothetical protein
MPYLGTTTRISHTRLQSLSNLFVSLGGANVKNPLLLPSPLASKLNEISFSAKAWEEVQAVAPSLLAGKPIPPMTEDFFSSDIEEHLKVYFDEVGAQGAPPQVRECGMTST